MMIKYCSFLLSNVLSTTITVETTITIAWLCAAFGLLLLELTSPGLLLFISFSIGCFSAALASFLEYAITTQWSIFFITLVCSFFALKKLAKNSRKSVCIKTNIDNLIGQTARVTEPIREHVPGRVKIKGEEWPALCTTHTIIINKDTFVRIVAISGNKLLVQPCKDNS